MLALNLLGDPALNIDYQFDTVSQDSTDLAVSGLDMTFTSGEHDYAGTGTQSLTVNVSNLWRDSASSVPVEVWRGPPADTASALLNSFTLSSVPAHGKASWTGSIGSFSVGDYDIYVIADPDDQLEDPIRTNNVSYRTLHVRAYASGFPVAAAYAPVEILDAILSSPRKLEIAVYISLYGSDGTILGPRFVGPMGNIYRSNKRYFVEIGNPVTIQEAAESYDYFYIEGVNYVKDAILLDHGGPDSMLVAMRTQESTTSSIRLYHLRGFDSTQEWVWPIGDASHGTLTYKAAAMAAGDVTGDGVSDVVYAFSPLSASAADSLGVINGKTGTRAWAVATGDVGFTPLYLRLVDIENDGQLEIVTNTRVSGSPDEDRIQCYSAGGSLLWQVVAGELSSGDFPTFHAPADIDHDGVKEIVFARGTRLGVISPSGSSATVSAEVNLTGVRTLYSMPLEADIDGDDRLEIIVLCRTQDDHYLNHWSLELQVYDDDLTPITPSYQFPWLNSLSSGIVASSDAAIADIDGDGVFEVVFTTPDLSLHAVRVGTSAGRADWTSTYSDAMRTGLYEQVVGGTYNEPVAIVNRARALESATFIGGLTVTAPATVAVATHDSLIVHGPLSILGCEEDSVRVSIDDFASPDSYWAGLVYDDSLTRGIVNYCNLSRAETAVCSKGSMNLANSVVEDCTTYGVALVGTGAGTDSLYLHNTIIRRVVGEPPMIGLYMTGPTGTALLEQAEVSDCSIGMFVDDQARLHANEVAVKNAAIHGVDLRGHAYANLSGTTVESAGLTAIKVHDGGTLEASSSTFKTSDYGADVGAHGGAAVEASFTSCTFTANDVGVTISDGGTVSAASCQVSGNASDGLYCFSGSSVTLSGSTVNDNENGLKADACAPEVTDNTLSGNVVAVDCDADSSPLLRRNKVWSNDVGIALVNDGVPDMDDCGGVCPSTCSNANSIKLNDPWQVFNDNGVAFDAKCNYWGGTPQHGKFYGPISLLPWLSSDPLPAMIFELPTVPKSYSLSPNYPNPFNPGTTVAFEVPSPGGRVRIRIFNVSGQLVKTLASDHRTPGRYEIRWDGTDGRGGQVASGVYFLEMVAPQFHSTRKMLLIK